MAEFAGVSEQALRKWFALPGFPRAPDGSVCLWDLAVWRTQLGTSDGDVPDDLKGGSSPALERYRLARAKQEEIRLDGMIGEFVRVADIRGLLAETAGFIRKAVETLRRNHGSVAANVVARAVEMAERSMEMRFGGDSTEGYGPEQDFDSDTH